MPKVAYTNRRFTEARLDMIQICNQIINALQSDGYDLTLRQLYYQLVSRDIIPNSQKEYKKLGDLLSKAREAGLVDWNAIVDRTRSLEGNSHWKNGESILRSAVNSFKLDLWEGQEYRVEVWVEKEALAGVIGRAATELDVDYFSCRGYASQTSMWHAGRRLEGYDFDDQKPVVIHLGDHDPSGMDMSRDIEDRLNMYAGEDVVEVRRIALNYNQVEAYNPPPNPAKLTDSRARSYISEYGRSSWELDALDPRVLHDLIQDEIRSFLDESLYEARLEEQEAQRARLRSFADGWEE